MGSTNESASGQVCSLAGYVNHLCQDKGCTTVLDVGSGLVSVIVL